MQIFLICLCPCMLLAYTGEECIKCHDKGSSIKSPKISVADFYNSVHGQEVSCVFCHSAVVDANHMRGNNIAPVDCGICHGQENLHGLGAPEGNRPECHSCHTKHAILPASDKGSSVHETQLEKTCGACHSEEWGNKGYLRWFTSTAIRSHKKQDFSGDFSEKNCIGCHQGMAVHGDPLTVNNDKCRQCHMNNGGNALMGSFHSKKRPGAFVPVISILSQVMLLIVLILIIRLFIIRFFCRYKKGEE